MKLANTHFGSLVGDSSVFENMFGSVFDLRLVQSSSSNQLDIGYIHRYSVLSL